MLVYALFPGVFGAPYGDSQGQGGLRHAERTSYSLPAFNYLALLSEPDRVVQRALE